MNGARTRAKKEFAPLMLFLDSHPLPPPTWEGVLHSSGFSSYEGAVRRALRANETKQENPRGVFLLHFVPAAFGCRGLRLLSENRSERIRYQNEKEQR